MIQHKATGRWLTVGLALAVSGLSIWVTPGLEGQDPNAQGAAPTVSTRGPIHAAFAEPITFDAKPGPVAPKQPPPLVEEVPPDEKPDGDNVAWIPGYWQWEEDRKDYLWVSGFWRVLPPGRKWVPGYWNNNDDGTAQWVTGYWASADQEQAEYLPAPPATLENGAQVQPPTENHVWTPGTWVWRETRYMWRPGFWVVAQPGWVWVPAYYAYSPCGYVYVDGYWDWSLRRRGVLFAPCYWSAWSYRPRYVYRPTICIDVDLVTDNLFCRTGFSTYYFGDYYGGTYVSMGFTPWFSFHYARGGGYCPVYAYNSWYYRRTPQWEVNLRIGYDNRFRHVDARPPRTYIAQQNIVKNVNVTKNVTIINNNTTNINSNNRVVAKPISEIAAASSKEKDPSLRFRKVDPNEIKQVRANSQEAELQARKRLDLERQAAKQLAASNRMQMNNPSQNSQRSVGGNFQGPRQPLKLDLPKSNIVAKPTKGDGDKDTVRSDGTRLSNRPPENPLVNRSGSGRGRDAGAGNGNNSTGGGNTNRGGRATDDGVPGDNQGRKAGEGGGSGGGRSGVVMPTTAGGRRGGDANKDKGDDTPSGNPGTRATTPAGGRSGTGTINPGGGSSGGGSGGNRPIASRSGGGSGGSGSSGGNRPGGDRLPSGGGNKPPSGGGSGSAGSGSNRPPSGGGSGSGQRSGGSSKPSGGSNKEKEKPPQ